MKLGSSYLLNGLACLMASSIVAVACGSDSDRKSVRDTDGGAGGLGGAGGDVGPTPSAGSGGEVSMPGGGVGGEPTGVAGMPELPQGGEGGGSVGGAGGGGNQLPALDCNPIVFPDSGLESVVRIAISKQTGDITPADVAGLLELQASGAGVADLTGIGCLSALQTAEFGTGGGPSNIANLSPLAYLTELTSLNLAQNPIEDLAPLGDLPNLEVLRLDNSIEPTLDLSPLATAPKLKTLYARSNEIGDVTPLGQISTLETLDLAYSKISVPSSVGKLTQLKELYANGVLTDATPLGKLTQLTYLDASNGALTNTAALASLVNLAELDLGSTAITSIAFASNMKKLSRLGLFSDKVTSLVPLQNLPLLNILDFTANPIASLAPLAANTGLGTGDFIYLTAVSGLTCANETANITALKNRGVTIYGSPCN